MRRPQLVLAGVAAGATAVTSAMATLTTTHVAGGHALDGEVGIFRVVNELPDAFEVLLWPPMQLGSRAGPVAVALTAAVALRRVGPPVALLVAGFGAHTLAEVIKDGVGRARPAALLTGVHVRDTTTPDSFGFPSSHVATAVGLAVVIVALLPRRAWRVAVWTTAGLVALGRLFVGAHLPLDVVGGAAAGLFVGAMVRVAADDRAGLHP